MDWKYSKSSTKSPFKRKSRNGVVSLPLYSVSSFLLAIICISILSALYIGSSRRHFSPNKRYDFVGIEDESKISDNHANENDVNELTPKKNNVARVDNDKKILFPQATIHSLGDLTPNELNPHSEWNPNVKSRHMVQPPPDTSPIHLVTCQTTVGFLHVLVHPSWAPLGAQRFLRMVNTGYFHTKVALMRCVKNFICQFGIAGDPSYNKDYNGKKNLLQDDPNWLPEGPTHRTNELGVERFAKGYLAYAGAGNNSRSNQFIVALGDNERLGGGSPWEVPWGEVVGKESFETLDKIYTGYGEKGPSQPRLSKEGSSEGIAKEFPKLDYILSCDVIDST